MSTTKKYGMGFGLAYIREVISEHKGDFRHILPDVGKEIEFSSANEAIKIVCTRNLGCIFKISLPFIEAKKYLARDKYNILIIDDDKEITKSLKETIKLLEPSQFSRFNFEFKSSPQILIDQEEIIDNYDFILLDYRFTDISDYYPRTGGDAYDSIKDVKRKEKVKLYSTHPNDPNISKYKALDSYKIFTGPEKLEALLKELIYPQTEIRNN